MCWQKKTFIYCGNVVEQQSKTFDMRLECYANIALSFVTCKGCIKIVFDACLVSQEMFFVCQCFKYLN